MRHERVTAEVKPPVLDHRTPEQIESSRMEGLFQKAESIGCVTQVFPTAEHADTLPFTVSVISFPKRVDNPLRTSIVLTKGETSAVQPWVITGNEDKIETNLTAEGCRVQTRQTNHDTVSRFIQLPGFEEGVDPFFPQLVLFSNRRDEPTGWQAYPPTTQVTP